MRLRTICVAVLLAAGLAGAPGCAPKSFEFRLQKAESERDACEQALRDERAKGAALATQVQAEQRKGAAAQAELSTLRERVAALQQKNDEYYALIEKRAAEPLTRPAVPATPLPAELDQALQAFATKYQNRVWYERGRGAVSFANDQLFEPGSDAVRADAHAALHELAEIAARTPADQFEVIVVGHTDDAAITREETRAKHPTNWHLSVHRAIAVEQVMEQAGMPAVRAGVMGYGPYRPVGGDRAGDRRVEVFLVRKGEIQPLAPVRPPRR